MVRSMMDFVNLPTYLWDYALEIVAYILNRVPTKSVPTTPYEIWKGKKLVLTHIKIWGCPAHVKRHNPDKLESRTKKMLFCGISKREFWLLLLQSL